MTDVRAVGDAAAVGEQRAQPSRLLGLYRALVLVFGGFLGGILAHALWIGATDTVSAVIPFTTLFVVLVAGLVWWQRRASGTGGMR